MRRFPEPIQNLAAALTKLPGVGPKTALRYVFALLQLPKEELLQTAILINELSEKVKLCPHCFSYTQKDLCEICSDPRRDNSKLCVVETSRDISTLEATGAYSGKYFVLGGVLNPIEGMTPEVLRIQPLFQKLREQNQIQEIVLAFSPDVHGETTMMYLTKQLAGFEKQLTRLARGLPAGASLEFADEVTLGDAIKGRKNLK
ncbi:MAG: Recombination protein RecR [Candidatus Uhrbacteria bacterium GW2011_GWE2_45_35]|uniref:Recombination protein RecR n=2 Tax=Candidatus Uhriibacteriota TaxID=1752732 RepID=A0A0G1JK61_9BACT|nr:MAG: Recombination protein RecR [Candidatus Uhrbacteria bacterium GW2011_GWF2_44_350]KKU08548.1 MAG: Recombination protein RecR [Candidatus Uhrbacteria bacterium GW2011_GWE2_45_35]HBR80052.1 recombination protein RecR [Candidatus Uhrbacteria bacterium]HCU31128.1 recombination protein RecR [Candidatus Uhrbacteria bacterium]